MFKTASSGPEVLANAKNIKKDLQEINGIELFPPYSNWDTTNETMISPLQTLLQKGFTYRLINFLPCKNVAKLGTCITVITKICWPFLYVHDNGACFIISAKYVLT